jgi:hypothetical protein
MLFVLASRPQCTCSKFYAYKAPPKNPHVAHSTLVLTLHSAYCICVAWCDICTQAGESHDADNSASACYMHRKARSCSAGTLSYATLV